jgi:hypothetical protein
MLNLLHCAHDRIRAVDTTVEDLSLVVIAPAVIAHASTGQVHDTVDTIECGEVDGALGGIPGDFVRGGRCAAHDALHLMAGSSQMRNEGGANEAR